MRTIIVIVTAPLMLAAYLAAIGWFAIAAGWMAGEHFMCATFGRST